MRFRRLPAIERFTYLQVYTGVADSRRQMLTAERRIEQPGKCHDHRLDPLIEMAEHVQHHQDAGHIPGADPQIRIQIELRGGDRVQWDEAQKVDADLLHAQVKALIEGLGLATIGLICLWRFFSAL